MSCVEGLGTVVPWHIYPGAMLEDLQYVRSGHRNVTDEVVGLTWEALHEGTENKDDR